MKRLIKFWSLLLAIGPTLIIANGEPKLAPAPPLGWNSFDSCGVYLHQEAAMENLEAMGEHLQTVTSTSSSIMAGSANMR